MTCSAELRAEGRAAPRTCRDCGLGPCLRAPAVQFFEMKLRRFNIPPGGIGTAAVLDCGLCNSTISGMGGPGEGALCEPCGRDLAAGRLRGAVVRTPDQPKGTA